MKQKNGEDDDGGELALGRRRGRRPTLRSGGHRRSDTLLEDAMIAATALAHQLTVVTRNVRDFDRLGIDLLNPFEHESDLRR